MAGWPQYFGTALYPCASPFYQQLIPYFIAGAYPFFKQGFEEHAIATGEVWLGSCSYIYAQDPRDARVFWSD